MILMILTFCGCQSKNSEADALSPNVQNRLAKSFEKFEIIGEGTHFLTVKIDLPETFSSDFQLYGIVLDEEGYPIQKVSGYTHEPQLEGRNHIWFYFFLYAPGEWPAHLSQSGHLRFVVVKDDDVLMEKVVAHRKQWGGEEVKIFDHPSPPDEIPGYIVLKDYTFLAQEDYRKPQGYYVEGRIVGSDGEWTHFVTLSDVQGHEDEPEIRLEVDRGWLELTTGRSHSMPEAIAPAPPYVNGWWDGKGYFHPQPPKVIGL
jgi:hypothetical protein